MKAQIDLDEDLWREVTRRAAESGESVPQIIEAALREKVWRDRAKPPPLRLEWPAAQGAVLPAIEVPRRPGRDPADPYPRPR